jgi:hypothetical protein
MTKDVAAAFIEHVGDFADESLIVMGGFGAGSTPRMSGHLLLCTEVPMFGQGVMLEQLVAKLLRVLALSAIVLIGAVLVRNVTDALALAFGS